MCFLVASYQLHQNRWFILVLNLQCGPPVTPPYYYLMKSTVLPDGCFRDAMQGSAVMGQ